MELVAANSKVGIQVIDLYLHDISVLRRFGIPVEWALSIVVPIFKGKGDIRNCKFHRAVKLPKHEMKVVERVLERRSLVK